MMRRATGLLLLISLTGFIGCANMQTLSRTTELPEAAPERPGTGKAIHLDAQQRLVLINGFQQFCAEPSPDALAAYASSLGLGVSHPSKVAASLAQGLQSSTGSMGLRTQSITLMRDALYRMCEAYLNGALGQVQLATLLSRSQDLTAVILAVEQLTGAVAANQVVLTGTSGAGASASLLSNQQLLDAACKDEEAKTKNLEEAKEKRDAAKKAVNEKETEVKAARDKFSEATKEGSAVSEDERAKLKLKRDNEEDNLSQLKNELADLEGQVETKEQILDESRKIRETIESTRDSALTNAVANTSSGGQFSAPVQRKELSKEATQSIANAVQGMVKEVLSKDYTMDSCMALITNIPRDYDTRSKSRTIAYEKVQELCLELISRTLSKAITRMEASFKPDSTTEKLQKAISADNTLRQRLKEWLRDKGIYISVTTLMFGDDYAGLREQAINELNIK